MIYCSAAVATVMNIWCSGACLLLQLPPVYHFLPATSTLYICDKMLLLYDVLVHIKNSRPKRGLNNLLPKSSRIHNDTMGYDLHQLNGRNN